MCSWGDSALERVGMSKLCLGRMKKIWERKVNGPKTKGAESEIKGMTIFSLGRGGEGEVLRRVKRKVKKCYMKRGSEVRKYTKENVIIKRVKGETHA